MQPTTGEQPKRGTIRHSLVLAFVAVIASLLIPAASLIAVDSVLRDQYKTTLDNMIQEYRIIDTSQQMVTTYNGLLQDITNKSVRAEYDGEVTTLDSILAHLDQTVKSKDGRVIYERIRNTSGVLKEYSAQGLSNIEHHNFAQSAETLDQINRSAAAVRDDTANLILSELSYSASQQKRIEAIQNLFRLIGLTLLVLLPLGCAAFVVIFAGRLSTPLIKLARLAESIARGNLDTQVEPALLKRPDEIGSLSTSFSAMVTQLKDKINELHAEKAGVERKVEERTAELNEERIRLAASVHSLSLGFIMTDAHDNIVTINSVARSILSYHLNAEGVSEPEKNSEQHQWSIAEMAKRFGPAFPLVDTIHQVLRTGLPVERKEVEYNGRILRVFLASIASSDTHGKEELGAVILVEDITEDKVLERSKDEFFSIASHELRTPLTAIRGNASMIEQYYNEQLKDAQLKEMVGDIHESSVRLIEIVSDFLDASRLEQGKMQFKLEPLSMEKIIEKVVYELQAVLKEKHIYLKMKNDLDTLPPVYADQDKIKQILYNLIGNAVKFVDKGGVTVEAKLDGKLLKVMVSDTGRGIPPDKQQLLFHKFQQATDSILTRDNTRGTGLGLYISRLLTEKMGGAVNLEHSEVGKGSMFSFTIPLATAKQIKEATTNEDKPA